MTGVKHSPMVHSRLILGLLASVFCVAYATEIVEYVIIPFGKAGSGKTSFMQMLSNGAPQFQPSGSPLAQTPSDQPWTGMFRDSTTQRLVLIDTANVGDNQDQDAGWRALKDLTVNQVDAFGQVNLFTLVVALPTTRVGAGDFDQLLTDFMNHFGAEEVRDHVLVLWNQQDCRKLESAKSINTIEEGMKYITTKLGAKQSPPWVTLCLGEDDMFTDVNSGMLDKLGTELENHWSAYKAVKLKQAAKKWTTFLSDHNHAKLRLRIPSLGMELNKDGGLQAGAEHPIDAAVSTDHRCPGSYWMLRHDSVHFFNHNIPRRYGWTLSNGNVGQLVGTSPNNRGWNADARARGDPQDEESFYFEDAGVTNHAFIRRCHGSYLAISNDGKLVGIGSDRTRATKFEVVLH